MKAIIVNVKVLMSDEMTTMYEVSYESGKTRVYSNHEIPKTVAEWMQKNPADVSGINGCKEASTVEVNEEAAVEVTAEVKEDIAEVKEEAETVEAKEEPHKAENKPSQEFPVVVMETTTEVAKTPYEASMIGLGELLVAVAMWGADKMACGAIWLAYQVLGLWDILVFYGPDAISRGKGWAVKAWRFLAIWGGAAAGELWPWISAAAQKACVVVVNASVDAYVVIIEIGNKAAAELAKLWKDREELIDEWREVA